MHSAVSLPMDQNTAFLHAVSEGHTEVVKFLLKNGANVDTLDEVSHNSALHEASWKGHSQTVEVLCKHKANLYLKNKGHSALHLACQQGHNQTCRVILINGCKPDIKNNFGDSPLHSAVRYGHAGVVRILISANCNVNEVNKNGDTALHISAAMGRRKLTRILLEAGSTPTIHNRQNETAMDIALRKSYTEVQDIIANPPPIKKVTSNHKKNSKREKESSQGSKDSGGKERNDRHKKSKSGSSRSVHFNDEKIKAVPCHWSPYGCHMHPNVNNFPKPKLNSLPNDPLIKGEQYYIDLAGNIRKGPVGIGYKCYCAPLIQNVEKRMEKDKRELIDHIDSAHDSLNVKIDSLEKKTETQLVTLNETVKEKLAHERQECNDRVQRCALRERIDLERRQRVQVEQLKGEVKSWLSNKLEMHRRSCHEHLNQQHHHQDLYHNHNHIRIHRHHSSQANLPICHGERPQSSQGVPNMIGGRPKSSLSKSKSDMYLAGSDGEESDEEPIQGNHNDNQVELNMAPDSNGDVKDTIYVRSQSFEVDFEKLGARPKDPVRGTPVNGVNDNGISDNGSIDKAEDINTNDTIAKGVNANEDMTHDTDRIDDINLSADLMKSLRCNGGAYILSNRGESGESPFNDSGYRTKFSPSPRETTISAPHPHITYGLTVNSSPPVPQRVNQRQVRYAPIAFDPPIGLPPPEHSHLIRRFPVPVTVHTRPYNGPNSSLV